MSKVARARAAASAARRRAREKEAMGLRALGSVGTGALLGSGVLDPLPRLPGIGRTGTVALVGYALAFMLPGRGADVGEGAGLGGLALMGNAVASGQQIAGHGGGNANVAELERRMRELAARDTAAVAGELPAMQEVATDETVNPWVYDQADGFL